MKSIMITQKDKCFICRKECRTEEHHIFGGGCRKLSEKYGLKVYLCRRCHNEPPDGVHFNADKDRVLKALAQNRAMYVYGWSIDRFREIFRKSYI